MLLLLVAFLLKCVSAQAQGVFISDDAITLTVQPTGSAAQPNQNYAGSNNNSPYDGYTLLGQSDNSTAVPPPQLGTYDLNGTSALAITAAAIEGSVLTGSTTLNSTTFEYRVYQLGAVNKPAYTPITFTTTRTSNSFSGVTGSTFNVDVLNGLTNGGNYILDVRFSASATRNGNTRSFFDPSSGNFYATFYVTPPPTTPAGGTTVWQSTNTGVNGNRWFVAANWSNGIPTAASDAVIPENTPGSNIVFPLLDTRTLNYAVRNLTLQGTTNSGRAQLTIQAAVLHVYGNISQLSGGLVGTVTDRPGVADSTQNSTLILAGDNQFITGRLAVPDIIVAGTGVKSVANTLLPTNTISLRPKSVLDGVVVQTASDPNGTQNYQFDTTGNSIVNLGTTGSINTNAGSNETITSYIKGVMTASSPLVTGVTNRFGNLGLEMTPNHPATLVTVQRIIGDPLIGPTSNSNARAVPIKRQYNINGDDNSNTSATAGSTNTIVFRYLPSAFELNGIAENNLTMFSTTTGSAPFTPLYGTLNTTARTVTQVNVPSFSNYYLTLGDLTNPLPVTLISFSATRNGENAKLVWATASEKNNSGFEVQLSNDGKAFRTLGFVASQGSNSTTKLDYAYTDTEAGKTGVRYYRLHQIDLDGTDSYSPVRAVSFDGAGSLASELSIYPNPATGDDVRLLIQTSEAGTARLRITDLMGRVLTDQTITTASGSTETKLNALATAKNGTYLAQLTLPSGQIKTIKVQKQ
jgi:hypothetical protein